MEYGEDSAVNKLLQITGVGQSTSMKNFGNVDFSSELNSWQPVYQQRPATSIKKKGPLVLYAHPDRSGSLEDALVIRSKNALKKNEKDAALQKPLHQKHTISTQSKQLEKQGSPENKRASLDSAGSTTKRLNDLNVSSASSDGHNPMLPKALMKLKIIEYHSQPNSNQQSGANSAKNTFPNTKNMPFTTQEVI